MAQAEELRAQDGAAGEDVGEHRVERAVGTMDEREAALGADGVFAAYAEVLAYFDSLSFVRAVGVDEAYGDSLRLGITMRGDRALDAFDVG